MNQDNRGYIAFYSNNNSRDTAEVYATSLFNAKQEAIKVFAAKYPRRKVQSHQIVVMLAEVDGQPYIQTADM